MAIHLGCPLPDTSSDRTRRHEERATLSPPYLILLRMGFARPASRPAAGALLPHHFTLTGAPAKALAHLAHWAGSGGVFSVALSLRSPSLAVSEHPALWSSDFPQPRTSGTAAIRPAPNSIIPANRGHSQPHIPQNDGATAAHGKRFAKTIQLCYNTRK